MSEFSGNEPIQVVIVEDDEACYELHKKIIEQQTDMTVTGCIKDKQTALKMVKVLKPDVMLIDINLTDKEDQFGIDIAIELSISMPSVKIIMLSGILNEDTVRSTMGLGVASNYLLKSDPHKIPSAIRDVLTGSPSLEGSVVQFIMKDYKEALKTTMIRLTSHQIKVLELFYRGYTTEEVADALKMEIQSVRNLQQNISKKCLGWKWRLRNLNSLELAKRAKKMGLF